MVMKTKVLVTYLRWPKFKHFLLILALCGLLYLGQFLPVGVDWSMYFRPASLAILAGESPYGVAGFYGPPWLAWLLLPLALLPEAMGRVLLIAISVGAVVVVGRKLGLGWAGLGAVLLSPPMLLGLYNGNIDALVLVGAVLPPWVGAFFLLMKPQLGAMVLAFWIFQEKSMKPALPVYFALWASFLVYGPWPLVAGELVDISWNYSFFPHTIPIGLALFAHAVRRNDVLPTLGAGLCLSPYVNFTSWIGAIVAGGRSDWAIVAGVVGLWVVKLATGGY